MSDQITKSANGAKSSVEPDYTMLPTAGLLKAVQRFELGLGKYARDNWRAGLNDPVYLRERLAHAMGHLFLLRDALEKLDRKESLTQKELDDHVGAVLWFGMFAACHHQVQVLDTERAVQTVSRGQRTATGTGSLIYSVPDIPHPFQSDERHPLSCVHCGGCFESHIA